MRVQNSYHRHKAFPDIKTLVQNVYQPHISLLNIKTRVQDVYRPQIAFSNVNIVYRTCNIHTQLFRMSKQMSGTMK